MNQTTTYQLNGEWVSLERFRQAKGIGQYIGQSVEPEKEVIEVREEKIEIVEPEIKPEIKIKNKKK
jgi:hypothetical protein